MSATQKEIQRALGGYLDPAEIVVSWIAVAEVVGQDGTRYLIHRAGGGAEGEDNPTVWNALGMLRSGMIEAEDQLRDQTVDADGDDGE